MKDNHLDSKITQAASNILENPLMVQKLCDRVYELWLEELRQQRERSHRRS
ncbi:MAG: hypothetical protein SWZ49_29270 [Cyanobacteriota bacterium]|nr:hypothetical protein [Cyanobacteriota bacterium]